MILWLGLGFARLREKEFLRRFRRMKVWVVRVQKCECVQVVSLNKKETRKNVLNETTGVKVSLKYHTKFEHNHH